MTVTNLVELKALIEADLGRIFLAPERPQGLGSTLGLASPQAKKFGAESCAAANYPLKAGGKRVRPLLVHLFAASTSPFLGAPRNTSSNECAQRAFARARSAASALELVHTYSLVHDDLPCMDNDDFRRGIPTTHKVYGEAKALLVGDGLLTKAFEILAFPQTSSGPAEASPRPEVACELVRILATCAGSAGMVLGQWLDLSFTDVPASASWTDLELIHRHKTGMLLAACCEMGLLCGINNSQAKADHWNFEHPVFQQARTLAQNTGFSAGLAFQIVDDILDATQSSEVLGKTAGKDASQNKLTAVTLLGMEGAQKKAQECTAAALTSYHEMLELLQQHERANAEPLSTETSPWQATTLAFLEELLGRRF